jgi:hypothetical protein
VFLQEQIKDIIIIITRAASCRGDNMLRRTFLLAVVAAAVLAQACADPRIPSCKHLYTKCCSKCYEGEENEPCDTDHYCLYQDPKEYNRVQDGGVICAAIGCGIMIVVILFRDILQVWTCGGITTDEWNAPSKPDRQLTTMSAAYAAETMPHTMPNIMQQPAMQQPAMQQPMMSMGFNQHGFNQVPQGGMPMMR